MHAPQQLAPAYGPETEPSGRAAAHARLARWNLWLLGATIAAIAFGAVVRITGSGAGCGQHWPTCQGEVAHLPRTLEAAIELTHRVTSAGAGLLAFIVAWPAFRLYPRAHPVRRAVAVTCAFMLVEGWIGAYIVRSGLVADDASVGRALFVPLHLVSTSVLTGAVALAAWWSRQGVPTTVPIERAPIWIVFAGMMGVLLTSAFGAVTALGDTLYPVASPLAGLASARESAHFLEQLRVVHPLLAISVAVFLFTALPRLRYGNQSQKVTLWLALTLILTGVQLVIGIVNVLLGAPGWMQIVHLLIACFVWISLVILASEIGVFSAYWRRAVG